MSTAVILGGGVSGLSAAYYLLKNQTCFTKIILLEASSRVGGWMRTVRTDDGGVFEQGPRSLRNYGHGGVVALDMIHDLGLSSQVMPISSDHPAAKNRFIYHKNTLHQLHTNPLGLLRRQPLFSRSLLRWILAEPFQRRVQEDDISLHAFTTHRLGTEIADLLVDPMCRGIFAGDARNLSFKSTFPAVHNMANTTGSLVTGALRAKKGTPPKRNTQLSKDSATNEWVMWTMKEGMEQISDSLHRCLSNDPRCEVRLESPCRGLTWYDTGGVRVKTDHEDIEASHVFSAVSASALADILPPSNADLIKPLRSIKSVSAVVVNLEYDGHVMPVQGFGHLIPSSENPVFLGAIYDSCVAPHHNRTNGASTRLTTMFGGAWFNELVRQSQQNNTTVEEWARRLAVEGVRKQLSIAAKPSRVVSRLNRNCIPQYTIGHATTLSTIHHYALLHALPLTLLGSSYSGVSVVDCILNAQSAVQKFVAPN